MKGVNETNKKSILITEFFTNYCLTKTSTSSTILIAPLDWGLGHATRCIPIIRSLTEIGYRVVIATSGLQELILKHEFPENEFLPLGGYKIKYSKHWLLAGLLFQIPSIWQAIKREHYWLNKLLETREIAAVISDNRYGLYSKKVTSVLITHQLALQLPAKAAFLSPLVNAVLHQWIRCFNACWVPDVAPEAFSLAGALSHPSRLPPIPIHYIGWLSRFSSPPQLAPRGNMLLVVLSGPEPHRTLLETELVNQLSLLDAPFWLVRGVAPNAKKLHLPAHCKVIDLATTKELEHMMSICKLAICRSGYSTLMDAIELQTPLICIPTPGQTEQLYLAKRCYEKNWTSIANQADFIVKDKIADFDEKKTCWPTALHSPSLTFSIKHSLDTLLLVNKTN